MGRKRTGTVEWHGDHWDARPRLADGKYGARVCLKPKVSEAKAREKAAAMTEEAAREGICKEPRQPKPQPLATPIAGHACDDWFAAWLNEREQRGLSSVRTDRGRYAKWLAPLIGKEPMATIATEDLERVVEDLDRRVRAGELSWKTARNTWGLVSKAFDDASRSKTLALRVRKDNPAKGVRPPDEGPARGKQFAYPSEFSAVMVCDRVPLRWRRLIAVQTYLYCRAGELEALHVDDVDLEHRTVHIHRAIDRDHEGRIKETKTNNPRRIPIEPNLAPLLEVLVADARAEGRERLVKMPPLCDLAPRLRQYLRWAGVSREELYRTTPTSKQITWHDLRATAATWLAIRGEAPQTIMAKCGHENMETTMGYIRLAAVLHAAPESVFPALPESIIAPNESPEGPATWGSIGGKSRKRLGSKQRPQRDSNPTDAHGSVQKQAENVRIDDADTYEIGTDKYAEHHGPGAFGRYTYPEAYNPTGALPSPADAIAPRVPDPHAGVAANLEHALHLSLTGDPAHEPEVVRLLAESGVALGGLTDRDLSVIVGDAGLDVIEAGGVA